MHRVVAVLALIASACSAATPSPVTDTVPAVPGDLSPGVVDVRVATMSDGTRIDYGLILPAGFDPAVSYPVLVAFPPGDQSIDLAASVAATTYLPEALDRSWVVVTPAAPGGTLFFEGSESYVDELLATLGWLRPEGGRYHLAGISNGGRSAFAVALLDPGSFASMAVFPGYPASPSDRNGLAALTGIPIAMFVGGDDPEWLEPMTVTRDTIHTLGGPVLLDVRDGEGHVMSSLSDGVDIFDFLDSTR